LYCKIHDIDFVVPADICMKDSKHSWIPCPKCSETKKLKNLENKYVELECAFCKKQFKRLKSKLNKSKSGLYFCCKEHKILAQKLSSDEKFSVIRPEHYGTENSYRQKAFDTYEHKCAVCGFDPESEIYLLDVHHIDEDRNNNDISNLIILCPICHRKITHKKYKLINRNTIVKNEDFK